MEQELLEDMLYQWILRENLHVHTHMESLCIKEERIRRVFEYEIVDLGDLIKKHISEGVEVCLNNPLIVLCHGSVQVE